MDNLPVGTEDLVWVFGKADDTCPGQLIIAGRTMQDLLRVRSLSTIVPVRRTITSTDVKPDTFTSEPVSAWSNTN